MTDHPKPMKVVPAEHSPLYGRVPDQSRADAIAALAEAIMAAESDDAVPWNERPRPGQVLDNLESLGWRLVALGAEAETPRYGIHGVIKASHMDGEVRVVDEVAIRGVSVVGAKAETPTIVVTHQCGDCGLVGDLTLIKAHRCLALGAEAETPDIAAADTEHTPYVCCAAHYGGGLTPAGRWVDLASPEAAETLRDAIDTVPVAAAASYVAGNPCSDAMVDHILAAMRETGR